MASLSVASPRLRHSLTRVAVAATGVVATGVLLTCGIRIALGATVNATYLVPSGRRTGYPGWMRGPLAGHSAALPLHTFLVLMSVMTLAWVAVVVCASQLPNWFVIGAVIVTTLTFTLAPPLLSTDVFNYIAYGQMGTSGINPYLHGPEMLIGQPVYAYTGHLWKAVPSAYGPLFTLLTYVLAPAGVAASFWVLKALSGASLLALAALIWLSARQLGRDPRFAVALACLNPLVLVYALGGAHNDLIMAVPLAAAVYLALVKRPAAAGATAVSAIAIKASAGLALPFVLLAARPRRQALSGALAAGALAVGASLLVFGTAVTQMAGALAMQQRFKWIVVSVPSFAGHYLGIGEPSQAGRHVLMAFAAAVVVGLLARARGGRGCIEGAAAASLVVLATTAWVLPWYVVWTLPFAALVRGRMIPAGALVLTVLLLAMQLDHFVLTHGSHHARAQRQHAVGARRKGSS